MKKNIKKIKDSDFEKMERVYSPRNKYVAKDKNFYFSYGVRLFFMFFSIFAIAVIAYECFDSSFSKEKDVVIDYEEKGSISYNVKLFEDNLFQTGELTPVNGYISDLVNDIGTDFKYEFKLDKNSDIKYSYYVDAIMELKNSVNGKEISKNEYRLMDEVEKELKNSDKFNINQNINLDYDYYNKLAKDIIQKYKIDINGNLYLKMYIDITVDNSSFKNNFRHSEVIDVKIPLLSNSVSASMVKNIDSEDSYIEHKNPELINKLTLFVGITLLIVDTIFFLVVLSFVFKTTPKKSKYCKLRDGLLREHNKLIVNSKNMPPIKDKNVIDCYSFSELMDAQKLLNKPIIYYEIVKNQKCVFVLISDSDVYKFVLKEVDIDF